MKITFQPFPYLRHVQVFGGVILVVMCLVGHLGHAEGSADLEKGKTSFQSFCAACHGLQGKGDGPAGRSFTPPPADLTKTTTQEKSDKDLLNIIQNGKPGTAMPPWKQSLSPQQIQAVLAYIRSLR